MNYKNSTIVLAVVLVAGVVGISYSSPVFGQEYGYDRSYDSYDSYDPHEYKKQHSKSSTTNQIANCNNIALNINGIDQRQIQRQTEENTLATEALDNQGLPLDEALKNSLTGNGNGDPLLRIDRNIVNVCINENNNDLSATFTGAQAQVQGNGAGAAAASDGSAAAAASGSSS